MDKKKVNIDQFIKAGALNKLAKRVMHDAFDEACPMLYSNEIDTAIDVLNWQHLSWYPRSKSFKTSCGKTHDLEQRMLDLIPEVNKLRGSNFTHIWYGLLDTDGSADCETESKQADFIREYIATEMMPLASVDANDWKSFGRFLEAAEYTTKFADENDDSVENIDKEAQLTCGHYAVPYMRFCPSCGRLILPSPVIHMTIE